MSKASEIFRQYHASLVFSQQEYESLYKARREATEKFYKDFFNRLVCNFAPSFRNEQSRRWLQDRLSDCFNTNKLSFVAIDGTCDKDELSDLITFFGAAYGARGEIDLEEGSHRIRYKRWSLEQDVSMVAWVPVPIARLDEVTPDQSEKFVATEQEKINLSSVHHQVMQLAEVFLAYNTVRSSRIDAPHIVLMDLSPSSVLASVAQHSAGLGLEGYPYDRRSLTSADITIALSHPFSSYLGIPSLKEMDYYRIFVRDLHTDPAAILDVNELARRYDLREAAVLSKLRELERRGVLEAVAGRAGTFKAVINPKHSWAYVKDFFQNICERLFLKKDPKALQYSFTNDKGLQQVRWMAPEDVGFLIGVGMRALIEECWERNVLLYGIVKDSQSKYLTRNYLGVALETDFYTELKTIDLGILPWTDRLFCELLPVIDSSIDAPWATIEFDSAYMTLHRGKDETTGVTAVSGVMGRIVNQEKLFVKSLSQFFLKRGKSTPLMGHVVFLERLLTPMWDLPDDSQKGPARIDIATQKLGRFSTFVWRNNKHENPGQLVMMYLLSVLTRNHYAEAIGYPDPLHKADWGAKSVGRNVRKTIKSSGQYLKTRPLSETFRTTRDARKR